MVAWLSDAPDAESDEDIWGKREQNLTQLSLWLADEEKSMALRAQKKAEKKKAKKNKGKQKEV